MKPVLPTHHTKEGVLNRLTATFGEIHVRFLIDATGRVFIGVTQPGGKQLARAITVTLHKFFEGQFAEVFYPEDFQHDGEEWSCRVEFPKDRFLQLAAKEIKVSADYYTE